MSQIGFVMLTHAKPHQALRLVKRLNSMFGRPPIVIHHDFSKCLLTETDFPANVSFVHPHVVTAWGEFNLVQATLRGLEQMYARPDAPEWCVLLSAAHYPTKPAAQILEDLTRGGFDAHIDTRRIGREFRHTEWFDSYYRRHCVKYLDVRSFDKRLRPKQRRLRLPYYLGLPFLPFRRNLRPFGGSQWFSVNRRAAAYLLDFQQTAAAAALNRYYRSVLFSDEVYFQTALGNGRDLSLNPQNWLYLDWSENTVHPKQLTLADLPALKESSTHFARKIDSDTDPDLIEALDLIIDGGVPVASAVQIQERY